MSEPMTLALNPPWGAQGPGGSLLRGGWHLLHHPPHTHDPQPRVQLSQPAAAGAVCRGLPEASV